MPHKSHWPQYTAEKRRFFRWQWPAGKAPANPVRRVMPKRTGCFGSPSTQTARPGEAQFPSRPAIAPHHGVCSQPAIRGEAPPSQEQDSLSLRFAGVAALAGQFTPGGDALLDLLLDPLLGRFVIALLGSKIILGHKMPRMIVAILVAFAMAEPRGAGIMRVSQVLGNG